MLYCCPAAGCGVPIGGGADLCPVCGLDLRLIRVDLATLMQPERPIRWPFAVLDLLSPDGRAEIVAAISAALR